VSPFPDFLSWRGCGLEEAPFKREKYFKYKFNIYNNITIFHVGMISLPPALKEANRLKALRGYAVINTPSASESASLRLAAIVEFSEDASIGKD
jgi:hypothetical protein